MRCLMPNVNELKVIVKGYQFFNNLSRHETKVCFPPYCDTYLRKIVSQLRKNVGRNLILDFGIVWIVVVC